MSFENRLLLVRHGASEWSSLKKYQGHLPVPLSTLGLQQVQALATKLNQYQPQLIISSDLQRTRQTAEIIANDLLLDIRFDVRLRELDCGRWAGLTEEEIKYLEPESIAELQAGHDIPRGGGETMADLMQRVRAALDDWVNDNFASTLILVSHAYVIRTIIQILLGISSDYSNQLPSLGSYTLLKQKDKQTEWILEEYGVVCNDNSFSETVQWLPTF
jgi:glucosyl-3-phosphoglycerate phosphatase